MILGAHKLNSARDVWTPKRRRNLGGERPATRARAAGQRDDECDSHDDDHVDVADAMRCDARCAHTYTYKLANTATTTLGLKKRVRRRRFAHSAFASTKLRPLSAGCCCCCCVRARVCAAAAGRRPPPSPSSVSFEPPLALVRLLRARCVSHALALARANWPTSSRRIRARQCERSTSGRRAASSPVGAFCVSSSFYFIHRERVRTHTHTHAHTHTLKRLIVREWAAIARLIERPSERASGQQNDARARSSTAPL